MKYNYLIFDLDGTLVDSRASIMAAMGEMCRAMGLSQEEFDRAQVTIGLPMSDILRGLGIADIETARAVYREKYRGYTHLERAFPGVPDVLERLHGRLPLSIATNKAYEGSLRTLDSAGIRGYFDFIASLDQGVAKPDPDAFHRIRAHYRGQGMHITPQQCLMIGDSPIDIEFARRSGIDCAFAAWGFHDGDGRALAPTIYLETPADILGVLDQP